MPPLLLVVLLPVIVIALMPLILIQRYRVGTARRMARPSVAIQVDGHASDCAASAPMIR